MTREPIRSLPEPYKADPVPEFSRLSQLEPDVRRELAERVVRLRLSGSGATPLKHIAEATGLSTAVVRKLLQEGFTNLNLEDPETVAEMRGRQAARYESLLAGHWRKAHSDPVTAEVVLRIMAQLDNVLGVTQNRIKIDAQVTTYDGDPKVVLQEIVNSLVERREKSQREAIEATYEDAVVVNDSDEDDDVGANDGLGGS